MRKLFVFMLIVALLPACKSGQQMTAVEPSEPEIYEPVEQPKPEAELPEEIPVLEESFDFELPEDEVNHDVNTYFVILGSFRISNNAGRFKVKLEKEGFDPVILLSETGLHRVCVNSYSQEDEARQRVLNIRRSFSEYHDAWLLIRKDI